MQQPFDNHNSIALLGQTPLRIWSVVQIYRKSQSRSSTPASSQLDAAAVHLKCPILSHREANIHGTWSVLSQAVKHTGRGMLKNNEGGTEGDETVGLTQTGEGMWDGDDD